jgi:YbbR domain-containing protein
MLFSFYICSMKKNLHIIIISFLFSVILWISISLSNDYYSTFKVPLKLVDFKQGLTSGSKIPRSLQIKVKGKGWKLIAEKIGAEPAFTVTANGDTGKRFINLNNYLSENQWLSSDLEVIDITPDTLALSIEKITSKKFKIVPDINLSFRPGYGMASPITIVPDSVIAYGALSELKKMNFIQTEKINISDLNDKIAISVDLKSIQGITYSDKNTFVTIDVQRIVDRNIDDVPVNVTDVPKDREVILLPNKITIAVKGGIDILGRLTGDQFRAYVNYRDVVFDTLGGIVPKVEPPDNVSIKYIKPEQLRYVIKKFN